MGVSLRLQLVCYLLGQCDRVGTGEEAARSRLLAKLSPARSRPRSSSWPAVSFSGGLVRPRSASTKERLVSETGKDDDRRSFRVAAGQMSYVDVGVGPPVVFVHGNPSSVAEYLPAIDALSASRRCVAMDHIGFGRSAKPASWDYLPTSQASNLAALLDSLDLTDVTMVVGDWGGPIGLSWALANPHRVRAVVLTNTWLWPVNRSLYYQCFSKSMGGPLGRHLTRRHNFFARHVTKRAWGTARLLTPELHAEFTDVHRRPDERNGMWVFPQQITGSSAWLASLWEQRRTLDRMVMALLWGMRDIAFRPDILDVWTTEFPDARVERLDDVGHFPALEATDRLVAAIASTQITK